MNKVYITPLPLGVDSDGKDYAICIATNTGSDPTGIDVRYDTVSDYRPNTPWIATTYDEIPSAYPLAEGVSMEWAKRIVFSRLKFGYYTIE